jgi:hypothetical protein
MLSGQAAASGTGTKGMEGERRKKNLILDIRVANSVKPIVVPHSCNSRII